MHDKLMSEINLLRESLNSSNTYINEIEESNQNL